MESAACDAAAPERRSRFEETVLQHRQGVWSYVLKLTGDRHAADDLCQEVLVRAFETFGSLRREEKARSWLFSISYHVAVDWMRRRSAERRLRRTLEREAGRESSWSSPESAAIRREEARQARQSARALWRRVESLPPIYREIVRLRYGRMLPLARIASLIGIPVGNVKVRLHRARRRLARDLEPGEAFLRPAV